MEDKFLTYAKVRLFTFWMQAIWLILNLAVCIYINVWAGSALNYLYIVGAILVVVLIIGIDFHYMQCVLFLKNHMERLNDKAAEDEENVRYAYQMDPTAPENIEEAQENEEIKRRQEEEIANKVDGEAEDDREMSKKKLKKRSKSQKDKRG